MITPVDTIDDVVFFGERAREFVENLREYEVKEVYLGNGFKAIIANIDGNEIVVGANRNPYSVVDFNNMYEVVDQLRSYGWQVERFETWGGWRKVVLVMSNPTYEDVVIQWEDSYGKHEDKYSAKIDVINSFDGSTGLIIAPYVLRQVCENGLYAVSKSYTLSMKHIGNLSMEKIAEKIDEAIEKILNTLKKYALVYVEPSDLLKLEPILGKKVTEKVISFIGIDSNPRVSEKMTLYDVIQGITYYYTHETCTNAITGSDVFNKINKVATVLMKR